jgi:hypothetical protein
MGGFCFVGGGLTKWCGVGMGMWDSGNEVAEALRCAFEATSLAVMCVEYCAVMEGGVGASE